MFARPRNGVVRMKSTLANPNSHRGNVFRFEEIAVDGLYPPGLRGATVRWLNPENVAAHRTTDRNAIGPDLAIVERELSLAV